MAPRTRKTTQDDSRKPTKSRGSTAMRPDEPMPGDAGTTCPAGDETADKRGGTSQERIAPKDDSSGETAAGTSSGGGGEPLTVSRLVEDSSSRRSSHGDQMREDGARVVTDEAVHTDIHEVEYEPGHRVRELRTVRTARTETIPVPYAGPVSAHPAPVG